MNPPEKPKFWHFNVLDAANRIPGGGQQLPIATLMERGDLRMSIYAPRNEDRQQPHAEDEIYFVIRGSGHFTAGDQRCSFNGGDLLFVPAGVEHRFYRFTGDLLLWVVHQGARPGDTADDAASARTGVTPAPPRGSAG